MVLRRCDFVCCWEYVFWWLLLLTKKLICNKQSPKQKEKGKKKEEILRFSCRLPWFSAYCSQTIYTLTFPKCVLKITIKALHFFLAVIISARMWFSWANIKLLSLANRQNECWKSFFLNFNLVTYLNFFEFIYNLRFFYLAVFELKVKSIIFKILISSHI